MKKLLLPFLSLFVLLTAFTCENEPLEGFDDPTVVAPLDCLAATQAYLTAASNFVDATDANYTALCLAYKTALENQIVACGDPTGGIQTLISSLGDCSSDDPDTCNSATAAADVALSNLNNAPAGQYTVFCNVYVMALESQIEVCGDADGSIQDIIDGLSDCTNNSSQSFYAKVDGVNYSYTSLEVSIETSFEAIRINAINSNSGQEHLVIAIPLAAVSGDEFNPATDTSDTFSAGIQSYWGYAPQGGLIIIDWEDEVALTVESHDTTNQIISGTFTFKCHLFSTPDDIYEITEGSFSINY